MYLVDLVLVMYLTVTINLVFGEMHVRVHVVNVKKCALMFSLRRCVPLYLHKDTTSCIERCRKHGWLIKAVDQYGFLTGFTTA